MTEKVDSTVGCFPGEGSSDPQAAGWDVTVIISAERDQDFFRETEALFRQATLTSCDVGP